MKKITILAVAAVALLFSGCMKTNDSYKKLEPVQQGIRIYQWGSFTNAMSLEQANIGLRVAMLVAEANKQGESNLEDVKTSKGGSLKNLLLGPYSKLEETADGFSVTFNPEYTDIDAYSREGTILIATHNTPLLEDAINGNDWVVTFSGKFVWKSGSGESETTVTMLGGLTRLLNNTDGTYSIVTENFSSHLSSDAKILSDWSGNYTLKPENMNFTYADNKDKTFVLNGNGRGDTVYTFEQVEPFTPLQMSYSILDAKYPTKTRIVSGEVKASLLANYDASAFPSTDVVVQWSQAEGSKQVMMTVIYNGNTLTF